LALLHGDRQKRRWSASRTQGIKSRPAGDLADYVAKTDIPDMLDDFLAFAMRKPVTTLTLGAATGLAFTQVMYGWPLPMRRPRTVSNGSVKRRRLRRKPVT
jgi:hypothetical protein